MDVVIRHTNEVSEASWLVEHEGFCPVELSLGGKSIVDKLTMDHHGEFSALEGVAVRAYRDHFGERSADPRFVVTGFADADACFAIASLAGVLSHPSTGGVDLSELAALINRVDVDPIGINLSEEKDGPTILLWNQTGAGNNALAFYGGVERWRFMTMRPPKMLLASAKAEESARVESARSATIERINESVSFVESQVWGFDVWYATTPVVVAYVAEKGNVTAGCRNVTEAERIFGPGGLKNVFKSLPEGWGGREAICGSPRGVKLTRDEAIQAARIIAGRIKQ